VKVTQELQNIKLWMTGQSLITPPCRFVIGFANDENRFTDSQLTNNQLPNDWPVVAGLKITPARASSKPLSHRVSERHEFNFFITVTHDDGTTTTNPNIS